MLQLANCGLRRAKARACASSTQACTQGVPAGTSYLCDARRQALHWYKGGVDLLPSCRNRLLRTPFCSKLGQDAVPQSSLRWAGLQALQLLAGRTRWPCAQMRFLSAAALRADVQSSTQHTMKCAVHRQAGGCGRCQVQIREVFQLKPALRCSQQCGTMD